MMPDTSAELSPEAWVLEQLVEEGPALVVTAQPSTTAPHRSSAVTPSAGEAPRRSLPDRPDAVDQDLDDVEDVGDTDLNAGAKRLLRWLGGAVATVAVVIVLAFIVVGAGSTSAPTVHSGPAAASAVVAVPTTTDAARSAPDLAVPYTPSTDSCPGGPTSPLSLTDTTTDAAWVCSRGPQESRLDGQVLHVTFGCQRTRPDTTCSYMLRSVSVTPGWVPKTPAGKDEWLQHRVVTRLQVNFYNGDRLAADPFFLDTGGVHGPVSARLPGTILASRADIIVLHTERPAAAPTVAGVNPGVGAPDSVSAPSGLFGSARDDGDAAVPAGTETSTPGLPAGTDPVDATFAISQLQFFGHTPS
jgi:hypothetical protein